MLYFLVDKHSLCTDLLDRGFDTVTNTTHGEYTPEHVHHNYLYTDAYEKSREARGKEGAMRGMN